MVKLDDNRYGIIYMTTKGNDNTVNYTIINEDGKEIYSEKFKGYCFQTGSQPIVYNGCVVWMVSQYNTDLGKYRNKMYAIPALKK